MYSWKRTTRRGKRGRGRLGEQLPNGSLRVGGVLVMGGAGKVLQAEGTAGTSPGLFLSSVPACVIVSTLLQLPREGRLLPSPPWGAKKPQSTHPAFSSLDFCPPTVLHKVILPSGFLLLIWLVWEGRHKEARMQAYSFGGFISGLRSRLQRIKICLSGM